MTSWSPSGIISAYLAALCRAVDGKLALGKFDQNASLIVPPAWIAFHDRDVSPDPFYHPSVFVWVPQNLRKSLTIRCPRCKTGAVSRRTWVWRRIVDMSTSFFVLAKQYTCKTCSGTTPDADASSTFATCDASVLHDFPSDIQAAFPAIMLQTDEGGLSRTLVSFMLTCSKINLAVEVAHDLVVDMHVARYIERKAAFEATVAQAIQNDSIGSSSDEQSELSNPVFFSSFDDPNGYGGFLVPVSCLRPLFDDKEVSPDAVLWTGSRSVVVAAAAAAAEVVPAPAVVPAISMERNARILSNQTSPETGSSEPKRKRRPRRCQNRILVKGEVVVCGLMDCPGRGGQKFCKNFTGARCQTTELTRHASGSNDGDDLSKLSTLATLVRPIKEYERPVRESERVAMEALENLV